MLNLENIFNMYYITHMSNSYPTRQIASPLMNVLHDTNFFKNLKSTITLLSEMFG